MKAILPNFAILVPTKALINEVTSRIINDLKELLAEQNYRLVTSAGALSLKQDHNFIFVVTPERLLYLLIDNPRIEVDYLFVDEAHKISSKGPRSTFYYKVVDMLCQRAKKTKVIFASPNIPNPEVYLKLIPGAEAEQLIVESLLHGNVELPRHPSNQTVDSYALMRKFAIILLRDIIKGNMSRVWKEFAPLLDEVTVSGIKDVFSNSENQLDDDINTSLDQTYNLKDAIASGLKYPAIDERGNVDYWVLVDFLEELCRIFKWEVYERSGLGFISKDGSHGKLRWYAVILSQWIKGTGLSFIMEQTLDYKRDHPLSGVRVNGKQIPYDDTRPHRNIVISDTLKAIENVILFSISNYFLRFSSEYKRFHKVEAFQNDWYEYVEYGTTNPLSITLQRNGFSRETSTYIRRHRDDYVVKLQDGEIKLRRSLANCPSTSVRREIADIQYNIPELFID